MAGDPGGWVVVGPVGTDEVVTGGSEVVVLAVVVVLVEVDVPVVGGTAVVPVVEGPAVVGVVVGTVTGDVVGGVVCASATRMGTKRVSTLTSTRAARARVGFRRAKIGGGAARRSGSSNAHWDKAPSGLHRSNPVHPLPDSAALTSAEQQLDVQEPRHGNSGAERADHTPDHRKDRVDAEQL